MQRLRNPDGGCPWDLEQDFASIAPYTIEEAYEVADAIERNDASACLAAIDAGADVEARGGRSALFDYETPLLRAAPSPELVRLLFERGADPNARSGSNWTALMRACNAGCLESARLLLAAGADASVFNNEGYSAYGRVPRNQPELLALLEATGHTNLR